ncbi:MAG: DUF2164 domain-containing protein [Pseudomonadota bacterium]
MTEIVLSQERRDALLSRVQGFFSAEFDEPLSTYRAEALVDFMMQTLAPTVYNQAVQDVRAHLQTRLDDLDGEVYAGPTPDS